MPLAVAPPLDASSLLPGAQFADAYRLVIEGPAITARQAAERMFARSPTWVRRLMTLRNAVMARFGVRTPAWTARMSSTSIGIFPVVRETPDRLIAGFDDKHLDFRVIVDVAHDAACQHITATTIVRTHNLLGRTYLTLIMPFHRLIVRRLLQQVGNP
jgi:hypothetical protein